MVKNTEIPDDRVRWGSFDELREKTSQNLLDIMKKSSVDKNIDLKLTKEKLLCFITYILTPWKETNRVLNQFSLY